jgi:catalase-peroxidase
VLIWQDPVPAVDHEADRRRKGRSPKLKNGDPRVRAVVRNWSHRLGVGLHLPRQRQARRRQRRAHPPRAAEGLGGQRARRAGRVLLKLEGIQADFNAGPVGRQEGLAGRPDRAGGCAGVEEAARRKAGHDVAVPFTPGPHRCHAGDDRRGLLRRARAEGDGFRNYLGAGNPSRGACWSTRPTADADRSGDDRAGRRPARAGCQHGGASTACSPTTPDADQRLLRQPARHGHPVDRSPNANTSSRARPPDGQAEVDRHVRWTWCSAPTPQLRALAEVYAFDGAEEKFVNDFVAAWNKVMNARPLRPGPPAPVPFAPAQRPARSGS